MDIVLHRQKGETMADDKDDKKDAAKADAPKKEEAKASAKKSDSGRGVGLQR